MDKIRHKIMVGTGYYKFRTKKYYLGHCHDVYRIFVIFMLMLYAVQHSAFIYMQSLTTLLQGNVMKFQVILTLLININLVIKVIVINRHTKTIDVIHNLINHPIFAATCKEDQAFMKNQEKQIDTLLKVAYISLTITTLLWIVMATLVRIADKTATASSYYPFNTNPWPGYILSTFLEAVAPAFWISYGHYTIDCSVACYYIRAATQLKTINYHLERMFDDVEDHSLKHFRYKNHIDPSLNTTFIHLVRRYQNVYRLISNVSVAFNICIVFHISIITASIGICVYKMVDRDIFSVDFQFLFGVVCLFQIQNLLYCYCGHLVQSESERICTSMYLSNWPSVSPGLRRKMLIAMMRWSRPIIPRVSIVPVTLKTFESIVRSSYTFYTMMKSGNVSTR